MQLVDGVEIDYSGLPERHRESMRLYVERGCEPGSGLTAILSDKLVAVLAVDDDTLRQLPTIYRWIWQHMPPSAWGSYKIVTAWIQARRNERPST